MPKCRDTVEPSVLTPALCRVARGLLDWTQKGLADAVGVSVTTLTGYERHGADASRDPGEDRGGIQEKRAW